MVGYSHVAWSFIDDVLSLRQLSDVVVVPGRHVDDVVIRHWLLCDVVHLVRRVTAVIVHIS